MDLTSDEVFEEIEASRASPLQSRTTRTEISPSQERAIGFAEDRINDVFDKLQMAAVNGSRALQFPYRGRNDPKYLEAIQNIGSSPDSRQARRDIERDVQRYIDHVELMRDLPDILLPARQCAVNLAKKAIERDHVRDEHKLVAIAIAASSIAYKTRGIDDDIGLNFPFLSIDNLGFVADPEVRQRWEEDQIEWYENQGNLDSKYLKRIEGELATRFTNEMIRCNPLTSIKGN